MIHGGGPCVARTLSRREGREARIREQASLNGRATVQETGLGNERACYLPEPRRYFPRVGTTIVADKPIGRFPYCDRSFERKPSFPLRCIPPDI